MTATALILTCEHASQDVPAAFSSMFKGEQALLDSHRGIDKGAQAIFNAFKQALPAESLSGKYTRLLIDLNRSEDHPQLFSELTCNLSLKDKEAILNDVYKPFRTQVLLWAKKALKERQRIIHLSLHSFTPNLNGQERTTDIGFLYHPGHPQEAAFARAWRKNLRPSLEGFELHMNRPYQGKSDGHTQSLRQLFDEQSYIGLELEVNQKHLEDKRAIKPLADALIKSFQAACHDLNYDLK